MTEPKHPALAGRTAVNSVTWDLVAAKDASGEMDPGGLLAQAKNDVAPEAAKDNLPKQAAPRTVHVTGLPATPVDMQRSCVRVATSSAGIYRFQRLPGASSGGNDLEAHDVPVATGELVWARIYTEDGAVYSAAAQASDTGGVFLKVDPPELTEKSQSPVLEDAHIWYSPGTGDRGVASRNEVIARLKNSGKEYVSIGKNGLLTLEFRPPLLMAPGVITLRLRDEAPYEGVRFRFGNRAPEGGQDHAVLPDAQEEYKRKGLSDEGSYGNTPHEVTYKGGRPRTFRYASIIDDNTELRQGESTPGVDITSVHGNVIKTVHAVTILLDVSGSMSRRMTGQRLFQLAAGAVVDALLPRRPLYETVYRGGVFFLRTASNTDGQKKYTAVLQTRTDLAGLRARDTAQARADFTQVRNDQKFEFQDYTPLAWALMSASELIAESPTEETHHLLVVITDGEGSREFGNDLSSIGRTDSPNPVHMNIGSKKAALELVGFQTPSAELERVLTFRPPSTGASWHTSAYMTTSVKDLSDVLAGIKIKYGLIDHP